MQVCLDMQTSLSSSSSLSSTWARHVLQSKCTFSVNKASSPSWVLLASTPHSIRAHSNDAMTMALVTTGRTQIRLFQGQPTIRRCSWGHAVFCPHLMNCRSLSSSCRGLSVSVPGGAPRIGFHHEWDPASMWFVPEKKFLRRGCRVQEQTQNFFKAFCSPSFG